MHARLITRRRRTSLTALTVAMALAIAIPASTLGTARFPNPGFEYVTLTPAAAGGTVVALINSGDTFDGVTFEGIPDGTRASIPVGPGHTIRRPVRQPRAVAGSLQGLRRLRGLVGRRARGSIFATKQMTELSVAFPRSTGSFGSARRSWRGRRGIRDYTFFVNEESNDTIDVPAGALYGADPAISPYRQGGYTVALNTATG